MNKQHIPHNDTRFLTRVHTKTMTRLHNSLTKKYPTNRRLNHMLSTRNKGFLRNHTIRPHTRHLLRLKPHTTRHHTSIISLRFVRGVFNGVNTNILSRHILTTLPPSTNRKTLNTTTTTNRRGRRVFRVSSRLLRHTRKRLLLWSEPSTQRKNNIRRLINNVYRPIRIVLLNELHIRRHTTRAIRNHTNTMGISTRHLKQSLTSNNRDGSLPQLIRRRSTHPRRRITNVTTFLGNTTTRGSRLPNLHLTKQR